MSFTAEVFEAMIGHPDEMDEEVEVIRGCIEGWNSMHARSRKLILFPREWKTDTRPEAKNPQESIDEQITENSDLLIAVFKFVLGRGTVREIEKMAKAGKPVMVYFSSAPVPQDLIAEVAKVSKFKEENKDKIYFWNFGTIEDLRNDVTLHLGIEMNRVEGFSIDATVPPTLNPGLPHATLSDTAEGFLRGAKVPGKLVALDSASGLIVSVSGKDYAAKTPREDALYRRAIRELATHGFIDGKGSDEIFWITDEGFEKLEEIDS